MITLTKIWKKLLNEAGIPVSDIIDELKKNPCPAWEEDRTSLLKKFIRFPVIRFDVVLLRIE
jgi:hypothetical protein